jgi:hypothetical protein
LRSIGADKVAFSNLVLDHPEHEHASIVSTRIFRFNHARAVRKGDRIGMPTVFFYQIPFPWKDHGPPPIQPGVRYGCPSTWR